MAQPAFDVTYFKTLYPAYADIPDAILENLWVESDVIGTPIFLAQPTAEKQKYYYYVLEAHLAELYKRGPGAVGMVTSTTQGSVTVSFQVDQSNSLLFFNQTIWGQKIALLIRKRGGFRFIRGFVSGGSLYDNWRR